MRAEINFKYIGDTHREYHYQLTQPTRVQSLNNAREVKAALDAAENGNEIVLVVMRYEAGRLFDDKLATKVHDADLIKLYYFDRASSQSIHEEDDNALSLDFQFMHDKAHIIRQIEAIQHEIRLGNTYQVNYTTRLTAPNTEGNLYPVYKQLAQSHGDYTAYIEDDDATIVSISPELFFQYDLSTKEVLTKPMKGTMPTDSDDEKDKKNYQFLSESLKDKAENVMIVDLLRNDLSKIATKGSVKVPYLFTIERFLSVYQMTSTVTANIGQHGLYDILKALFPCGSITGAPKQSTMEIIDRLEDTPRSVYCGSIGLIVPGDVAIFNVPIRTMEYIPQRKEIIYGVGGGITIDSVPELEYEEMVAKSNVLKYIGDKNEKILPKDFHLIETMRVSDGIILRKDYHLKRLLTALQHFDIDYNPREIEALFEGPVQDGMYRVTVDKDGRVSSSNKALGQINAIADFRKMQFNKKQFHQYKTSVRRQYQSDGLTLFHDGKHLLEFNIGNVVIKEGGEYYTPKHDDILQGCMRAALIDDGVIQEKEIAVDPFLEDYKAGGITVYMINSVREWVEITLDIT